MQLAEFLSRLLPSAGRFISWYKTPSYTHQDSYPSLEALQGALEDLTDTPDVYFATAAFDPDTTGRSAAEVIALKAHRIDIDAGEAKYKKHGDKVYRTFKDAVADLKRAVAEGLPNPTMVIHSGAGLHLYWELDEPVSPQDWKPVAEKLKTLCTQLALRQDPAVTADAARILRPVGSLHNNGNRVRVLVDSGVTYTNDVLHAAIADELEDDPLAGPPPKGERNINDDVLLTEFRSPPTSLAKIAEHCGVVAEMRDTGGNIPEPLWRLVIGLAKHCDVDGRELVHEWSQGYEGYSAKETDDKMDRWETPPPLCTTFAAQSDKCATCKHRGTKVTTPKMLGWVSERPAEEPTAADTADAPPTVSLSDALGADDESSLPVPHRPDLFKKNKYSPFRLVVTPGGKCILVRETLAEVEDETGDKVKKLVDKIVSSRAFWVESATQPGAGPNEGSELLIGMLDKGLTKTFTLPAELLGDPKGLSRFLFAQGVNLGATHENSAASVHAADFLRLEVRKVQEAMRLVIRDRFGYRFHEGQMVCCQGEYTVYPDRTIRKTLVHQTLRSVSDALTPAALPPSKTGVWGPEVWATHVVPSAAAYIRFVKSMYFKPGFEIPRLALALGFASPFLMFFADVPFNERSGIPGVGLMVTLMSQRSGSGKSAVQEVIAAAFGGPSLKRSAKMTEIASMTLASAQSIYPFLVDETKSDPQHLVNMVYQAANGEGRIRARQDGSVAAAKPAFSCITMTSTNKPQRELLAAAQEATDATQVRLLELVFQGVPEYDDEAKQQFLTDMKTLHDKHSGSLGLRMALYAVSVGPEALSKRASDLQFQATTALGLSQEYRFYAKALGAVYMMHESLGKLSPFDLDELTETFKAAAGSAKAFVESQTRTPDELLEMMIADLSPRIAITKTWGALPLHPTAPLNPDVHQPIVGREVRDENAVYISADAIRKWCTERGESMRYLLDGLEASGAMAAKRRKIRITTGINNMVPQTGWYYKFETARESAHGSRGAAVVPLRPPPLEKRPEWGAVTS